MPQPGRLRSRKLMTRADPHVLTKDRIVALGMGALRRTPNFVITSIICVGSRMMARRPNRAVRLWQSNVQLVTGVTPTRQDTRAAIASWSRNLMDSIRLDRWSAERVRRTVLISDEHRQHLLDGRDSGKGVVLALPHMGSWDLAAVWGSHTGLAVSAVVEQLGAREFEFFSIARQSVGMRLYSHRDPGAPRSLGKDLAQGGIICLMADRTFSRHGIPVIWPSAPSLLTTTMPAGPATLAQRHHVPLHAVWCHYEGRRMVIEVSERLDTPDREQSIAELTQRICDEFDRAISRHPTDWHMFQTFVRRRPTAESRGGAR